MTYKQYCNVVYDRVILYIYDTGIKPSDLEIEKNWQTVGVYNHWELTITDVITSVLIYYISDLKNEAEYDLFEKLLNEVFNDN